MANIQQGKEITSRGIIEDFRTTVILYAYSGTPWASNNMPKFTRGTGVNGANAIPPNQLDNSAPPSNITFTNPIITASDIVTALVNATKSLTRIRNCVCNGYFQVNSAHQLQQTLTGKAIFKEITVDNFNKDSSKAPWWSKSPNTTSMTQNINVDSSKISAGKVISAADLNEFINNLKAAWSAVYGNTVTYNYYTCHTNCQACWCYIRTRR